MAKEVENPTVAKPDTKGHNIVSAKELQDLNEAIGTFHEQLSKAEEQLAEYGSVNGETKAAIEKVNDLIQQKEDALNARFDKLEAALARKGRFDTGSDRANREKSERTAAYFDIFRAKSVSDQEQRVVKYHKLFDEDTQFKALIVSDNQLGGYNAPPEFVQELIVDLQEQNPVRALFRQRSTSNKAIQIPRQTGHLTATWVSELESRGETTGITFGRIEIPAHEMHGQVNVSREDMEDSFFNLEQFVRQELTEQFMRAEGVAFIDGNGVGKPEGITVNADVTGITSATSGSFGADDIIALYYEPLDTYMANSTFVLKRSVIKHVRQLKDGNGNYLWAAGLARDARPATILDRPYVAADQMAGLGASNVCVVFGDFRAAYTVVDRVMMEVITDIFSSKASGAVEFSARKRVGGKVVLPQAIKTLTCGA